MHRNFLSFCFHQYQHLLKHCAEYVWPDGPPKVQRPAGPGVLVFTRIQILSFWPHSKKSHIQAVSELWQMSDVFFWRIWRWSDRLTPGKLGVHLVVRECLELTQVLPNGWENVGNSFCFPCCSGCHCQLKRWENTTTKPTRNRPTNNLDLHRNSSGLTDPSLTGMYIQLLMSPSLVDPWLKPNKISSV